MVKNLRSLWFTALVLFAVVSAEGQTQIAADRFGNSYTQEQISSAQAPMAMMGGGGACNPCSAGIFNLHFVAGSGLEIPGPVGDERRAVAIQVFEDLSVLLRPADFPYPFPADSVNDPWSPSSTVPLVQVGFLPTNMIGGVDWSGTLGVGSSEVVGLDWTAFGQV